MFAVDDFLAVDDLLMAELPVRQHVMRGLAALVDASFGDDAASLWPKLEKPQTDIARYIPSLLLKKQRGNRPNWHSAGAVPAGLSIATATRIGPS